MHKTHTHTKQKTYTENKNKTEFLQTSSQMKPSFLWVHCQVSEPAKNEFLNLTSCFETYLKSIRYGWCQMMNENPDIPIYLCGLYTYKSVKIFIS